MENENNFQDAFLELLLIHKMDVRALSEKTGISQSRLYAYKSGEHIPSYENAAKISDVFECSFDYLFGLVDERQQERYILTSTPTERFRKIIMESGLTRYKISKLTGITESKLSLWFAGKKIPEHSSLYLLAKNLPCSLDYLAGRDKI